MAEVVRQADIRWLSSPPEGHARISVQSRAFTSLLMAVTDDPQPHEREVTPGELLAAGFASAYATILSELLRKRGHQARELIAHVACTFTGDDAELALGHQLVSIDFRVRARVAGLQDQDFAAMAEDALAHFKAIASLSDGAGLSVDPALITEVASSSHA